MPVKNRFAELHDDISAWRRDIHQNPEILFETCTNGTFAPAGTFICARADRMASIKAMVQLISFVAVSSIRSKPYVGHF